MIGSVRRIADDFRTALPKSRLREASVRAARRCNESKTRRTAIRWISAALAGFVIAQGARAADIRLRAEAVPAGPVVTLGDVADVLANDGDQAARLRAIELFPGPAAGAQRFVRVREIQDLLLLRGVNLAEHQLSGASQVIVRGSDRPANDNAVSAAEERKALSKLREAITTYLRDRLSPDEAFSVEASLPAGAARLLADYSGTLTVRGGSAPWKGHQRFELILGGPQGGEQFEIEAQVRLVPQAVVAVRPLARGAVIGLGDVELRRVEGEAAGDMFFSIEEVLGRETMRAVTANRPLLRDALRSPLLVRRGDVVTVYARSPGIQVRTTARAKDDGAEDDLIAVESFQTRKVFLARVCGVREAEVFAQAPRVEAETGSPGPATTAGRSGNRPTPLTGPDAVRRGQAGAASAVR